MKELPDGIRAALNKTDAEMAAEFKQKLADAIGPALRVMDEAHSFGFMLGWQGLMPTPPDGRHRVINLTATKVKMY